MPVHAQGKCINGRQCTVMDTDADLDLDKAVAWVMSDEYRIWSNDLALKRMQDYVQRGRKHANLSDKDALLQ
jgi:hypothetical protein